MDKETAKEIFTAIKKQLDMYSHIHKYAEKAKQPSDTYFDNEDKPYDICSVWDANAIYQCGKDMGCEYEAMNELQDNIEYIANSYLLKEIERDMKSLARDFGIDL